MNIEIKKIVDRGIINREKIVFSVVLADSLGRYMVFKTKKLENSKVSSRTKLTYWFPDKEVSGGDLVILYTKNGTDTEQKNQDGSISHFFYIGKSDPAWESEDDAIVLSKMEDWTTL